MRYHSNAIPNEVLDKMNREDRPKGKAGKTTEELTVADEEKGELSFHNDISRLLMHRGIAYGHADPTKKSRYTVGWPDFVFAFGGQAVGLEAKTRLGKPNLDQQFLHEQMVKNGWLIFIVRDLGTVKTILDELQRRIDAHKVTELASSVGSG
jgi:hypothetical protein